MTLCAIPIFGQVEEPIAFEDFAPGPYEVAVTDIDAGDAGAPAEMRIFIPATTDGKPLPLVYMNHGFLVQNQFYTRILTHLSSHGFAVIAPQMYGRSPLPFGKPSMTREAELGERIIAWALSDLGALTNVSIQESQVSLMGHSRGGQVAWNIARRGNVDVAAIVGVDPVDGQRRDSVTRDGLASIPSLTLGAGLGGSCAPDGRNYENFFAAVDTDLTQWLVVGDNFGHMDMLDGSCGLPCSFCRSASGNNSPDQFIEAVSGSATAFLQLQINNKVSATTEVEAYFALTPGYSIKLD